MLARISARVNSIRRQECADNIGYRNRRAVGGGAFSRGITKTACWLDGNTDGGLSVGIRAGIRQADQDHRFDLVCGSAEVAPDCGCCYCNDFCSTRLHDTSQKIDQVEARTRASKQWSVDAELGSGRRASFPARSEWNPRLCHSYQSRWMEGLVDDLKSKRVRATAPPPSCR